MEKKDVPGTAKIGGGGFLVEFRVMQRPGKDLDPAVVGGGLSSGSNGGRRRRKRMKGEEDNE